MADRYTRREVLGASAAVSLAGLAGWYASNADTRRDDPDDATADGGAPAGTVEQPQFEIDQSELDPLDVRGAIYVPARAFNFYQQWADYDPGIIERDLGYATEVNLNAIRTWASFEFWREDPKAHREALEHFLSTAAEKDLDVLLGLFDFAGKEPTEKRLHDTNPRTATGVRSPSSKVMKSKSRWDRPEAYVRWFMDRYRDDDRLLGISAMNEPGWRSYVTEFAGAMFETMAENRGDVPLTVGSTSMANNTTYLDWGCEQLQFHYNFAESRTVFRDMLAENRVIASEVDVPVWLSEWQRVREATGFASEPPDDQKFSDYSSLAPLIHEAGFGNFFWSLMVQPAFVPAQRKHGVLNGLFHEDGAVWSLDDARSIKAMSGDSSFDGRERQEWPKWASGIEGET